MITVFAGIFILITKLPTIPHKFRNLRIEIVDSVTQKPLNNINVYYILETAAPADFLGIPLLDPINFRYIKFGHYKSNINGIVEIKNRLLFLKLYEKVFCERVYINLDIESNNGNYKNPAKNFFFNIIKDKKLIYPNKNYRGAIIYSGIDKNNIKKNVIKEKQYDLIILDGKNLESKDDVIITVEIRRKVAAGLDRGQLN